MSRGPHIPRPVSAVVLALLTASCWWVWMAWDRTYQVDPSTGASSGPYEAWQVIGCALCLVVLCVVAAARLQLWLVVVVMTAAFTLAWAVTASAADRTGLWAVGAVSVLAGMIAGTGLVGGVTAVVTRARGLRPRRSLR